MKTVKTINDDDFTYVLEIQDSKHTINARVDKIIRQGGITAYWTILNSEGKPIFGTPVQDKDHKIIAFESEEEAIHQAERFLGFK